MTVTNSSTGSSFTVAWSNYPTTYAMTRGRNRLHAACAVGWAAAGSITAVAFLGGVRAARMEEPCSSSRGLLRRSWDIRAWSSVFGLCRISSLLQSELQVDQGFEETSMLSVPAHATQAPHAGNSPRYVLVDSSDKGEAALQREIAASRPRTQYHFVDMESTADGLERVLVSLSGRPVGIIAIPYAACTSDIDATWRRRVADAVGVLRKKGFLVYAAAGNYRRQCEHEKPSTIFPASVAGACAVGAKESPNQSPSYAALDSGYPPSGRRSVATSSAATGKAALRGRPSVVARHKADCGKE